MVQAAMSMGTVDKSFKGDSSVDRFVGGTTQGRKKLEEGGNRQFRNQDQLALTKHERPKTPEELAMIDIANLESDRLREKYGLPAYRVPPENIHLIKQESEKFVFPVGEPGYHSVQRQMIALLENANRNITLKRIFHEIVHFKSYASVNVEPAGLRRTGLVTMNVEQEPSFASLNEAVTEELTKRFMRAQEGLPLLWEDTANLREARRRFGSKEVEDVAALHVEPVVVNGEEKVKLSPLYFSYQENRSALHLLIETLQAHSPQTFGNKEECFDLFASAMFNGHLLELARHIERTFGEGAFRKLGEQKTGEALLACVNSFKKYADSKNQSKKI